jgi:hypothetical protein
MGLLKRIFLLCLITYIPLSARADCISDGGDPATCQLIDSINNLNDQLQGFQDSFSSIQDLTDVLVGIDFNSLLTNLQTNINDKINNINLGPLEPVRDRIGLPATIGLGVLAIPAAVKISKIAISTAVKGLVATSQKLHELITRKKRDKEWLAEFYEAQKNWEKMYAVSKKLESQIVHLSAAMKLNLLLNKSNEYIQQYGSELAINGIFAELEAQRSIIAEDLKTALRANKLEEAKELKHLAAIVEKQYNSARQVKLVLAGGMGGISESFKESHRQLQQVEGELQRSRAHILGSVDLWQKDWEKEYKETATKFRRARRKTDNFYRKAVRIARKDKSKSKFNLRMLRISNKIEKSTHQFEIQMIEETFSKQLEIAKEERKTRVKNADLLFVNYSAKFGEHQAYMNWFNKLTMQQINLSEDVKILSDLYDGITTGVDSFTRKSEDDEVDEVEENSKSA